MLKKILIANRGEIACRIIRTLKKMGIVSVAIYSNADQMAEHVKLADEAYCVGDAPAKDSYLCIDKIIHIAKISQSDGVHPGYGFLSENADFAKACAENGIVFIGPSIEAIEQMGSKAEAKALMAKHKVPILPGYHLLDQNEAVLLKAAKAIGFPILIKAAFGGGGRGMRVVEAEETFHEALVSAKREAINSFANDQVILEKYLKKPRHIEVQVFADQAQNYVYLFERDCSIQRRHQKVVEEAPAPRIDETLRKRLGEMAIQAAKAIFYIGAGTVEFLLADDQQFYFMEMNTRLQVEHPVTEMITGLDLVEWQVLVASGQNLPKTQAEIIKQGAAIEVRLCAEDPEQHFLPATGEITCFDYPKLGLRVDTGYCVHDKVSIYYDSLLAKMIAFGETREMARQALLNALQDTQVLGVKTNREILSLILQQPDFVRGEASTSFMESHEAVLLQAAKPPVEIVLAVGLCKMEAAYEEAKASQEPWQYCYGFRSDHHVSFTQEFICQQVNYAFQLQKMQQGWSTLFDGKYYELALISRLGSKVQVSINGKMLNFALWQQDLNYYIHYRHQSYSLHNLPRFGEKQTELNTESELYAPMPGRIVAIHVHPKEEVVQGKALLIMEAMKMEHTIRAPFAGIIKAVNCQVGDIVAEGLQLIDIEKV